MATNATSADNGTTTDVQPESTDDYERVANDIAVEFDDGVPATHRHAIRSLLFRLTVSKPHDSHDGIMKYNVHRDNGRTWLTVWFDSGCITPSDVHHATQYDCTDVSFQAWHNRVAIKFPD